MLAIALCNLELPSSKIPCKLIALMIVTMMNPKIEAPNNPG
jgi:hypothetical protein